MCHMKSARLLSPSYLNLVIRDFLLKEDVILQIANNQRPLFTTAASWRVSSPRNVAGL